MIKTISKTRQRLIADLFARVRDCRCYSLGNGFRGEPCAAILAWRDLDRFTFAKLRGEDGSPRYTVHVHDNLWYEFTVSEPLP